MKYIIRNVEDNDYLTSNSVMWSQDIIDATIFDTKDAALDAIIGLGDYLTVIEITFNDLG